MESFALIFWNDERAAQTLECKAVLRFPVRAEQETVRFSQSWCARTHFSDSGPNYSSAEKTNVICSRLIRADIDVVVSENEHALIEWSSTNQAEDSACVMRLRPRPVGWKSTLFSKSWWRIEMKTEILSSNEKQIDLSASLFIPCSLFTRDKYELSTRVSQTLSAIRALINSKFWKQIFRHSRFSLTLADHSFPCHSKEQLSNPDFNLWTRVSERKEKPSEFHHQRTQRARISWYKFVIWPVSCSVSKQQPLHWVLQPWTCLSNLKHPWKKSKWVWPSLKWCSFPLHRLSDWISKE